MVIDPALPAGRPILVTGSSGLIGTEVRRHLEAAGDAVVEYDLRAAESADVLDYEGLLPAMAGCRGVIHLAAISRVVWGERDPVRCRRINVGGLNNVIRAAKQSGEHPWILFASSREVYGRSALLPVAEDTPVRPVNVYGASKAEGEQLVRGACKEGVRTAIARLSNVYGSAADHADRVVPAFVRAALAGQPLKVEGSTHTFDFTHVSDVASGLVAIVRKLDAGNRQLPDLHFVTGQGTTLGQLADLVLNLTQSGSAVRHAEERAYDVEAFVGNPVRAERVLRWRHRTPLRKGLADLIAEFRALGVTDARSGGAA